MAAVVFSPLVSLASSSLANGTTTYPTLAQIYSDVAVSVAITHTPNPMGFLNDICGRPESDKPYILLVAGYPAEGATIPLHATVKKPLSEIATFL